MKRVGHILTIFWVVSFTALIILGAVIYYFVLDLEEPEQETNEDVIYYYQDPSYNTEDSNPSSETEPGQDPEPAPEPASGSGSEPGSNDNIEPSTEPEPEPEPETPVAPPDEPAPDLIQYPKKSWTTLFYVAYDNSIGPMDIWESDVHFLEQIGSDDNINLVALVDQELYGDCYIQIFNEGSSYIYPITEIDPTWDEELNTGDSEILNGFLKWGFEMFPADHFNIHIMDHGGGWMGACIDESSDNSMISAPEFAEVFAEIKDDLNRKIDLVSFDACFMASFEFGWEVADYVEYLTGMQTIDAGDDTGEYTIGNFDVYPTWNGLKENPDWTSEQFAIHQVNSFHPVGPYLMPSLGHTTPYSFDTMAACDLKVLDALKESFIDLSIELYDSLNGDNAQMVQKQLIQNVIGPTNSPPEENTESFSGQSDYIGLGLYYNYDLGDFVTRLIEHGDFFCNPETAEEFLTVYDNYIINIVHGEDFTKGEHPDATGSNIYIPYRNGKYKSEYDGLILSEDTMWDEFLKIVPWND
jgi:hypothetical protein